MDERTFLEGQRHVWQAIVAMIPDIVDPFPIRKVDIQRVLANLDHTILMLSGDPLDFRAEVERLRALVAELVEVLKVCQVRVFMADGYSVEYQRVDDMLTKVLGFPFPRGWAE